VIRLREFEKKIADIKEKIEKHVFHPYLRQFIIPPVIDEDKLLILISIVDQLQISPHEKDTFVIAIMLMNVALDTHDKVSNTLMDEKSMKVRQLTVLAGDYYSGLYYKHLAEIGDIQLIKMLSEGVKNVNEHKVSIYHKDPDNLDTIMNGIKTIEFSLIEKMTSYFGVTHWNDSTSNLLFIKRLLKEASQFEQIGTSVVFDAIEGLTYTNHSIDQEQDFSYLCDHYLENAKQLMINGLNKIPQINYLLEKRMIEMTKHHCPRAKSFVEEG